MSWTRADWSPIADQIRSFGTGLANVALRKQQLQRQLGKDLVDYDVANANMDLTRAKTQREEMDMANIDRLASMFDPGTLTPEQRTGLAANTMAGKNIFADALRGAKLGQEAAQAKELFDKGTPVERLSIVTGSAVKPYALNGRTGAVINQMTGEVTADTPLASRILGGNGGGGFDINDLQQVYRSVQTVVDPLGIERKSNFYDTDSMLRDIATLKAAGIPVTPQTLLGLRVSGAQAAAPAPAPAASAATAPKKDWTAGLLIDEGVRQQANALADQYRAGEITKEQLAQALEELGV